MQSQNDRMSLVHFQGQPFNSTVIPVYVPTTNVEKVEGDWFYEDPQDLLELTQEKKRKEIHFHHRWLECKSRMSRGTWHNRHLSTKWSRKSLIEFCQENTLVIANTIFWQHYRWTSPNGQYQNQIDYILCNQRWRNSTQSAQTRQD